MITPTYFVEVAMRTAVLVLTAVMAFTSYRACPSGGVLEFQPMGAEELP